MNKDPFSYFRFGFTENEAMRGTVNSSYSLFLTIGILGILLTIIIAGRKLMSMNKSARTEALEELKWKAVIAIVLFCIPTVIGIILSFSASFT